MAFQVAALITPSAADSSLLINSTVLLPIGFLLSVSLLLLFDLFHYEVPRLFFSHVSIPREVIDIVRSVVITNIFAKFVFAIV